MYNSRIYNVFVHRIIKIIHCVFFRAKSYKHWIQNLRIHYSIGGRECFNELTLLFYVGIYTCTRIFVVFFSQIACKANSFFYKSNHFDLSYLNTEVGMGVFIPCAEVDASFFHLRPGNGNKFLPLIKHVKYEREKKIYLSEWHEPMAHTWAGFSVPSAPYLSGGMNSSFPQCKSALNLYWNILAIWGDKDTIKPLINAHGRLPAI